MSSTQQQAAPVSPDNGAPPFEPRIVAFVCKWCTYAGADLAGTSRMEYPPNVRVLMLPCTGRIGITMPLRAFLQGADAVLISGCHPGDCHYSEGNFRARRRWIMMRHLLDTVGFDLRRLELAWISAAEGAKFVKTITDLTARVRALGPYEEMRHLRLGDLPPVNEPPPPPPLVLGTRPAEGRTAPDVSRAVTEALSAGRIKGVLAWMPAGPLRRPRPRWMTTPAEAEALVVPPRPHGNIARLLTRGGTWKERAPVGIVVRPVELWSLNVLAGEGQVVGPDLRLFVLDDDGALAGEMDWDQATVHARERLLDVAPDRPNGFSDEIFEALDRMAEWRIDQRWAFWRRQFERCVKCYACRQSCPTCYCPQCVVEKNQPQWIPTAADGAGNLAWHVVRAFHMEGRCVGCRACETACPEGIPLTLLYAAAARSNLQEFHFRAGASAEAAPLQSDFKPGDSEDFIL